MSLIKNLFIFSLINLSLLVAVLSFYPAQTSLVSPSITPTSNIPSVTPTKVPVITATPTTTPAPVITKPPTPAPTIAVTPMPDPLAGLCIITIDGVRYNVTDFRNRHSGGDVFTCGADLSQLFHDRHSDRFLQIMAQFRI